jgi:hypothetical protein
LEGKWLTHKAKGGISESMPKKNIPPRKKEDNKQIRNQKTPKQTKIRPNKPENKTEQPKNQKDTETLSCLLKEFEDSKQ